MTVFERNVDALGTRDSALAASLRRTTASPRIEVLYSKRGPLTLKDSLTGKFIHSAYDPIKEGERIASQYDSAAYLCVLGMGCGYHIKASLRAHSHTRIVIVEEDIAQLRHIAEHVDLRDIFLSERCCLLVDIDPKQLYEFVLNDYLPLLYPSKLIYALPSRIDMNPGFFESSGRSLRRALHRQEEDALTMRTFGRQWLHNIVENLFRVSEIPPRREKEVLLVSAGPSVERNMEKIQRWKHHVAAVDSILPFLVAKRVMPDMSVAIDCQLYGYLHFLSPAARSLPVFSQLSAYCPPFLEKLHFFLGNHPLEQMLIASGLGLPEIPSSGGNVATAALLLLKTLGYTRIEIVGDDFAYPQAKCYARGTYFYRSYTLRSRRLHTLHSGNTLHALRASRPDTDAAETRYVSHTMRQYKISFQEARKADVALWQGAKTAFDAGAWLRSYVHLLKAQEIDTRRIRSPGLMTLLPLAIWMAKMKHTTTAEEAIDAALQYTIRYISSLLGR